jgi:hypothetical protein
MYLLLLLQTMYIHYGITFWRLSPHIIFMMYVITSLIKKAT